MAPKPAHWNHEGFLEKFAGFKVSKDYKQLKHLLAQVAQNNYESREWFGRIPRTVPISYEECQKFRQPSGAPPLISFSKMDTVEALLAFGKDRSRWVCGLNFANGKDVGGGYKNGSTAQEEDLCRRIPLLYSSLYAAEKEGHYPFGPSTCSSAEDPQKYADVLYTGNLLVARAGDLEGFRFLSRSEQVTVSLLAAAAPNIRFASEVNDPDLIYRTIENIMTAPLIAEPGINTLILGAWGCGAFGGDPVQIASLFIKALVQDNLGQGFKEVHFAIPQTSPEDQNFEMFREVFKKHKIQVMDV